MEAFVCQSHGRRRGLFAYPFQWGRSGLCVTVTVKEEWPWHLLVAVKEVWPLCVNPSEGGMSCVTATMLIGSNEGVFVCLFVSVPLKKAWSLWVSSGEGGMTWVLQSHWRRCCLFVSVPVKEVLPVCLSIPVKEVWPCLGRRYTTLINIFY